MSPYNSNYGYTNGYNTNMNSGMSSGTVQYDSINNCCYYGGGLGYNSGNGYNSGSGGYSGSGYNGNSGYNNAGYSGQYSNQYNPSSSSSSNYMYYNGQYCPPCANMNSGYNGNSAMYSSNTYGRK